MLYELLERCPPAYVALFGFAFGFAAAMLCMFALHVWIKSRPALWGSFYGLDDGQERNPTP